MLKESYSPLKRYAIQWASTEWGLNILVAKKVAAHFLVVSFSTKVNLMLFVTRARAKYPSLPFPLVMLPPSNIHHKKKHRASV